MLISALAGGCGEDNSSGNLNVQPSPQAAASQQPFPKPSVPATINAPSKIALTRPTNPDDRLRVIKSGRNDPFGLLVPVKVDGGNAPAASGSAAGSAGQSSARTTQEKVGNRMATSYDQFLKRIGDAYSKTGASGAKPGATTGSTSGSSGTVDLPTLPKQPELADVKVTGVVVVAGAPQAIVQAPDEPTSRTVGIGDSLSGGRLYVKDIDMTNRAEPVVIFQQGDASFAVAVGRDPVLLASAALPSAARPVRGLYTMRTH
ncbi:MAG TPA: hypothetical protein V6D19_05275 [Stenomitos sp.]